MKRGPYMVDSIKHNTVVGGPAPVCEKVYPVYCDPTSFVLQHFCPGDLRTANASKQPSPAIEQKVTGRSCVLATTFCYDNDAPVTQYKFTTDVSLTLQYWRHDRPAY